MKNTMAAADQVRDLAKSLTISVHEPFAEFLLCSSDERNFSISLLDCYRLAGHSCHAITGAFLVTAAAVAELFPADGVCVRGDVAVDFGAQLTERATGPRSHIISYITGAWEDSGFPGLRGQFVRKNLMSFGNENLRQDVIRFRRLSTGATVDLIYDPTPVLQKLDLTRPFPESWRFEVAQVLQQRSEVVRRP
ncbi:hypothetical protein [Bdellovibrio sp. ArHS]|uniref:hypothetical protein n=1 Tax=Bdellovibrio sp. ArHS TaxID=1569284 RepID=UPI000B0E40FF|nr:hypothetical protein [Bdellovibrio sp. ArHS]